MEGEGAYHAMASGPGRARAAGEAIFTELGYRDETGSATFVLETDRVPPEGLIERIAAECGLAPRDLTFVITPTSSLAGTVQITARVLEVALRRAQAGELADIERRRRELEAEVSAEREAIRTAREALGASVVDRR